MKKIYPKSDRLKQISSEEELAGGFPHLVTGTQSPEERLAAILDNIAEASIETNNTGYVTFVNKKIEQLLGTNRGNLLGKPLWEVFPPGTKTELSQQYHQAISQQATVEFEEFYPTLACSVAVRLIPIASGVLAYFLDITEQKELETTLRKEQNFLNVLLDNVQAGIVACDAEGRLKLFNQAARLFHGLPEEPLLPEEWAKQYDLYLPDGKTPMNTADIPLFRALQGEQVKNLEMAIVPKQGVARILSANGQAIVDANGNKQGAVVVMHDITNVFEELRLRQQAEEKRVQLVREQVARAAAQAAQQQSAFLAEVSATLASSLDYEQTLKSIANLAVPYFGDWCSIDLLNEDGTISRVAVAHSDPEKVKLGWEIAQRYPRHLDDGYGVSAVMQTGQMEVALEITDEQLRDAIQDLEYLQLLRDLGLKSCLIAPLIARERVLGTISFVFAESNRYYSMMDLALAEDLAQRAAIAIDNARLYQAAQEARQAAEKAADRTTRLQTVTAALSESLTASQVAEVIAEQSMAALEAASALVVLVSEDRTELEIVKAIGYHTGSLESWRRFPIDSPVPLADAIRAGEPVWIETLADRVRRYPHLEQGYRAYDFSSWMSIPLVTQGKAIGGLSLAFKEFQPLSQDDREFVLALSRQCAQAIVRAQLYETERQARAEAEQANRIKDQFLAVLSHELRTPLNPILGWSRLLQSKKLDQAKTTEGLKTIERNAKLQAQLIEDLLDVSRILQGKLNLNNSPVNLASIIANAMETVRLAAEAKLITIQTILQPDMGQVAGDASRLQQIVWNLLANAIKFTPSGGQVEIRLERCNSVAQITVNDNGQGISPQFLPFVFDYFRQADSTTTRKFGGLGLGLAIVRRLVELHGGTVCAQSLGEGLGATFIVGLPLMLTQGQVDGDGKQIEEVLDLSGIKVLVVDDDADSREFVAFVLEQEGAFVVQVDSATEALKTLAHFKPDVLLSDIGMPQIDGYMLMQQVRNLPPAQGGNVKAIALTAYAGDINEDQAIKAGFQRHISKPVEPEDLIATIVELLKK
ncbi:MAG: ATP-binding protein [Nostoc sp. ChiSLP02]|nr:ATP-binding protein [Nostoc sp. DedSLP05]MDZ8103058.1 ATP-binding protein [Nostoc sp. DedSLP01]MDZ8183385.1 ATP-binding protein [Nostoc sp. ChiSLP02]